MRRRNSQAIHQIRKKAQMHLPADIIEIKREREIKTER